MMHHNNQAADQAPTFIDLFSGCGGLSLGLCQAGWEGIFAVERAGDAFSTFEANFLVEGSRYPFRWPAWLEKRAHSIDDVLDLHASKLQALQGTIDLIAGGPPCQGFSFAGKRNAADPRNRMFERYVRFVELVQPKFLVLENVPGMSVAHSKRADARNAGVKTFYEKLLVALHDIDYVASGVVLDASRFGVPQRRPRLVVVGMRSDVAKSLASGSTGVFPWIAQAGTEQLAKYTKSTHVSAKEAISDLRVGTGTNRDRITTKYTRGDSRPGFRQLKYKQPETPFQEAMNEGVAPVGMDSMRLPNHRADVVERFEKIVRQCRKGVNLSATERETLGMLKHRTVPMDPHAPAPTLTTLPDDILHYKEPRILTVRECARLQSFPDWFQFKGKYTTGGNRRRTECPRYTQVGNAVPPLLGQAVGAGILAYAKVEPLDSTSIAQNEVKAK